MLLVCSKSTRNYFPEIDRVKIVTGASTTDILKLEGSEEEVIAVGGGAVIDTAKIICKNSIISYPTTASGSTATSWSVYWDGPRKHSLERLKPQEPIFKSEFWHSVPKNVINDTIIDVISHCLDSDTSVKSNEESKDYTKKAIQLLNKGLSKEENYKYIMEAGHLAGKAIEITGTNLLHSLSYPLTGHYNISHGTALGFFLKFLKNLYNIDLPYENFINKTQNFDNLTIKSLIEEAFTYNKMNESNLKISKEYIYEHTCR